MNPKVVKIIRLAQEYARSLYRADLLNGKSEVEVTCLGLGQALAKAAEFRGDMIAIAAAEAFEDANFHDKAEELRAWWTEQE